MGSSASKRSHARRAESKGEGVGASWCLLDANPPAVGRLDPRPIYHTIFRALVFRAPRHPRLIGAQSVEKKAPRYCRIFTLGGLACVRSGEQEREESLGSRMAGRVPASLPRLSLYGELHRCDLLESR
ncbi:hypothetical protein EW146_g2519 [Bondarzewia mesenterica]|uniref:Uncharacterized protein n=1 Tax=Bondarzewia mesenterica TaxID=1095465 RepID=A0A4V3XFQ7_9AGAM|nr:hypothetical protein EW146_g2519 [Bondarzewia mesenterica]